MVVVDDRLEQDAVVEYRRPGANQKHGDYV